MRKFIKLNKIYFTILAIFTILIYSFGIKKNGFIDVDLIFLSSILLILIFFFNYIFIINFEIDIFPINVFFNLYFLICTLFFIYNYNEIFLIYNENEINFLQNNDSFIPIGDIVFLNLSHESLKILILTILFLNLGFLLSYLIFKKKKINFFHELNEIQLIRLNFFLLIAKLLLIIIHLSFSRYIEELINPINLLIVSICFYSFIFFKKNRLLNIFIIFLIFLENMFLTFSIYKNIILLTICFIIIYNLKKEISNVLLALLICWVFLGQSLKFDFRYYYNENYNKDLSSADNTTTTPLFDDYETRPVVLRLTEPIISLVRILQVERFEKREIKKDTISILKYSLIPRVIYPNKPKQTYAAWYTNYFFEANKKNKNLSVTFNIFWPSDFYINYRYLGSTVFAFIIGVILSLLSLILSNYKSNNIHYLFGLSIISGLTFPDYNLSLMLSPILLQLLILIFLLKFFIFIIKR